MKAFLQDIARVIPPAALQARKFVIGMHALPTVVDLCEALLECGLIASNTLFVAKPYSTIPNAQQRLKALGISFLSVPEHFTAGTLVQTHKDLLTELVNCIDPAEAENYTLLDSGGLITKAFMDAGLSFAASIQLTSSGSRYFKTDPKIVDLGTNPIKKDFESDYIASSTIAEIEKRTSLENRRICIIGHGTIGQAVGKALQARHYQPTLISGVDTTLSSTFDLIIGATGYDISSLLSTLIATDRPVDLFSCSSWDTEFSTLLQQTNCGVDLSNDTPLKVDNMAIHNGGCPINFNRQTASDRSDIAMTRGLTLAAALNPTAFDANQSVVQELYQQHFGSINYAIR